MWNHDQRNDEHFIYFSIELYKNTIANQLSYLSYLRSASLANMARWTVELTANMPNYIVWKSDLGESDSGFTSKTINATKLCKATARRYQGYSRCKQDTLYVTEVVT